jgi:phage tail sheath gpL-like
MGQPGAVSATGGASHTVGGRADEQHWGKTATGAGAGLSTWSSATFGACARSLAHSPVTPLRRVLNLLLPESTRLNGSGMAWRRWWRNGDQVGG